MPLIAGIDEIRQAKGSAQVRLDAPIKTKQKFVFFRATSDTPVAPSAYINQYNPGRVSTAHYHVNDQFQIIVAGKGTFGRHEVLPYTIHFSRGYTPYGPLTADRETGWAFLVLRTRYDPGPHRTAEEQLKQVHDRRPWQITKKVTFPTAAANGIGMHDDPEIKDNQGLFATAIAMAPGTEIVAPDAATGDGQFIVVVKGSLMHQAREHPALSVIFIKPDEERFSIHAGSQGLEGLILNMPLVKLREKENPTSAARAGAKKWQCLLCAFAYDEALGLPGEDIPAGTRWEDVPESWTCPDCSASKSDFEMVEV